MERMPCFARNSGSSLRLSEEFMPNRRQIKRGSFGTHLDDLVRVFKPEAEPKKGHPEERTDDPPNVHDRLFERAWRADADKRDPI
jgi:hypothetical protein